MVYLHVCTTESLRAGIDEPAMECMVCGHKTMYLDWVGCKCDTCQADTTWEGDRAGFVRTIRQHTKMTRKAIALMAGLKVGTIKSYEWKQPSKKYYGWLCVFIKDFYKGVK